MDNEIKMLRAQLFAEDWRRFAEALQFSVCGMMPDATESDATVRARIVDGLKPYGRALKWTERAR